LVNDPTTGKEWKEDDLGGIWLDVEPNITSIRGAFLDGDDIIIDRLC